MKSVAVIGAGLAGCEAALQCAMRGVAVRLLEMRPARMTEAHETGDVAELVCSNSLKSDEPENAHGLLKAELRVLGSALLECAERARVPGGKALVVDRRRFSAEVQAELTRAGVTIERAEVSSLPSVAGENGPEGTHPRSDASNASRMCPQRDDARYSPRFPVTVVATGPLTSQPMAEALQSLLGTDRLFFYDAIAPIVSAESLDRSRVFEGSRYGAGSDYLNCPMTEAEYDRFVTALLDAELHPLHEFENRDGKTGDSPSERRRRTWRGTVPVFPFLRRLPAGRGDCPPGQVGTRVRSDEAGWPGRSAYRQAAVRGCATPPRERRGYDVQPRGISESAEAGRTGARVQDDSGDGESDVPAVREHSPEHVHRLAEGAAAHAADKGHAGPVRGRATDRCRGLCRVNRRGAGRGYQCGAAGERKRTGRAAARNDAGKSAAVYHRIGERRLFGVRERSSRFAASVRKSGGFAAAVQSLPADEREFRLAAAVGEAAARTREAARPGRARARSGTRICLDCHREPVIIAGQN